MREHPDSGSMLMGHNESQEAGNGNCVAERKQISTWEFLQPTLMDRAAKEYMCRLGSYLKVVLKLRILSM